MMNIVRELLILQIILWIKAIGLNINCFHKYLGIGFAFEVEFLA